VAELALAGYRCDQGVVLQAEGAAQRVRVRGDDGTMVLRPADYH
jgi:hypothetical protein